MSLGDDLKAQVIKIFKEAWTERDGTIVPTSDDVKLGNDAVNVEATVLYADLDDSTSLVDNHRSHFAAEVYKAFLYCAAKIIRSQGGEITAYDGDRVMAVFLGDSKNTSAVKAALKLNYARLKLIQPSLDAQYPNSGYTLRHVVGIDTSSLLIARTGIRGANDLVWVGRSANYAAKLATLSSDYPTRITQDVYDKLHSSTKYTDGTSMWDTATWKSMAGMTIYRSKWRWPV